MLSSIPGRVQTDDEVKGSFFTVQLNLPKASLQEEVLLEPLIFLEELQDAVGVGMSLS